LGGEKERLGLWKAKELLDESSALCERRRAQQKLSSAVKRAGEELSMRGERGRRQPRWYYQGYRLFRKSGGNVGIAKRGKRKLLSNDASKGDGKKGIKRKGGNICVPVRGKCVK